MLDNRVGNNLLYLLSEKKTMLYTRFKGYIEGMCDNNAYCLIRNLSALGYLGRGNNKRGQAIVRVSPPMLIELPFISPQFMLIGARSPELLAAAKDIAKVKHHEDLPDSLFISHKDKEKLLQKNIHGDKAADFLKITSRPWAWDILEFSGNLIDYRKSLNRKPLAWDDVDREHIKEIFCKQKMEFKKYNGEKIDGEVLVKVSHYKKFSRHYLLNTKENKQANVNLDWGRFLALQGTAQPVLYYDRSRLILKSSLFLPVLLERGLTLCSGVPPRYNRKGYSFTKIVPKVANLVTDKLQQQLHEVKLNE